MHDGFGIMVSFGMTSAPFFESILSRNVFFHPRDLCYADLVASAVLFGKCLMFVMCNLANLAAESRHGALYVLLLFLIYLIFFKTISGRPIISKSVRLIFAKFSGF